MKFRWKTLKISLGFYLIIKFWIAIVVESVLEVKRTGMDGVLIVWKD